MVNKPTFDKTQYASLSIFSISPPSGTRLTYNETA
jgi:hypothetical protein